MNSRYRLSITPEKRRNRKSETNKIHISGSPTYRELAPLQRGRDELMEPGQLFLIKHARSGNLLGLEVHANLNTVGDFYERNAAIHPVILTIERHHPFNIARACPLAGHGKVQRFGFRYATYCKSARNIKGVGTSLFNLG
jgi:hypothetical protein